MTEERQSLFSVKDVEKAIVHFGIMEAIYPLLVIGYVLIAGGYTPLETLFLILRHFPLFMQVGIGLIIFKEALDIMLFRRWSEAKAAHAVSVEQAKIEGRAEGRTEGIAEGIAEGKAEGIAEGKAEGIAEGKAAGIAEGKAAGIAEGRAERDRQWAAWNQRRAEAAAKGEPFHEPPPHA